MAAYSSASSSDVPFFNTQLKSMVMEASSAANSIFTVWGYRSASANRVSVSSFTCSHSYKDLGSVSSSTKILSSRASVSSTSSMADCFAGSTSFPVTVSDSSLLFVHALRARTARPSTAILFNNFIMISSCHFSSTDPPKSLESRLWQTFLHTHVLYTIPLGFCSPFFKIS